MAIGLGSSRSAAPHQTTYASGQPLPPGKSYWDPVVKGARVSPGGPPVERRPIVLGSSRSGPFLPTMPTMPTLPVIPGGPTGGVGAPGGPGGTVGAGGGGSVINQQAQANPYLADVMNMYKSLYSQAGDLYNKPLDFAAERARMRESQSQKLNEMRQMAGRRGQPFGSQLAQYGDEFAREIAGAESGFGNRELEAKRNILGSMTSVLGGLGGVAGNTAADQMAQMAHQLGMQRLNLDSWRAQMELPLEYYKAQQAGQMNMLNLVKNLL